MVTITKNNHFNPCFWSALWNEKYYSDFTSGEESNEKAREQLLNYLEINTGKKLLLKAEAIHFEKNLGIAEIRPDKLKELYRENLPEEYESISKEIDEKTGKYFLDFENHFTFFENTEAYKALMRVIKNNKFEVGDKIFLSMFIFLHRIRSHIFINSLTELSEKYGEEKFDFLVRLKNSFKDSNFLEDPTFEISNSKWTVYTSKDGCFPLSDNPIIIHSNNIIVTLSPFLLLFVDLNKKQQADQISFRKRVSYFRFREYKKLTISHTTRGLVFRNEVDLKKWGESIWLKQRINFLKKNKNFNLNIFKIDNKELWKVDSISGRLK